MRIEMLVVLGAAAVFGLCTSSSQGAEPSQAHSSPPPFLTRGMPNEGHKAMEALAGDWHVKMNLYAALGTPDKPFTAELSTHREWVGDGRFLHDITSGDMGASGRYWRMGTLGYSTMDKRYEWVTQDGLNANMMIYQGKPNSGPGFPANLVGAFTDQGLLGEASAGKLIAQRTEITVQDQDHHTIDIYFTPPGEQERLIDRKVYTRIKR